LWLAGSVAKSFTAAAIGKVIHDESSSSVFSNVNVRWTTPLKAMIREDFVLEDEYATAHTTIEDALSHRSGLPSHDMAYGWDHASARDVVRRARHLPMNVQLRAQWQYNNILYAAVGMCVEAVTGRTLPEVLEERIWRPLDMLSTTFSLIVAHNKKDSTTGTSRLATGYYWHEEGECFVPDEYMDLTAVAGAGAIISSVNDLVKWMNALLDVSCPRKRRSADHPSPPVISQDLFQEMTTPRAIIPHGSTSICDHCSGPSTYGLGWFLHTIGTNRVVSHSGGMVGFGTVLYLVPEHGVGFVTMANTMGSSNTVGQALFLEVLQRLNLYRPDPVEQHEIPRMPPILAIPPEDQTDHQSQTLVQQPAPLRKDCGRFAGSIEDYLGKYWHPAYGEFTVETADNIDLLRSMAKMEEGIGTQANKRDIFLQAEPSSRTWPYIYLLKHNQGSTFEMHGFFPHGPLPRKRTLNGDSANTNEDASNSDCSIGAEDLMDGTGKVLFHTVYQYLYQVKAKFELGDIDSNSTLAKRLGMELSVEMTMSERAEKDSSAGMIWLERI
jgi:CubicO group peptidase (beta-lactamase class C family)